jgi:glycosyltransferase involved in cell wall biosynthesis
MGRTGGQQRMQDQDYIEQESRILRQIYGCLYPDQPVEIHLYWDKAKIETPAVTVETGSLGPEMIARSYLGSLRIGPAPTSAIPGKRVMITLPEPNRLKQASSSGPAWERRPRAYRLLHRLAPQLAEQAKFLVERRRKQRLTIRHKFSRLSLGTPSLPRPVEVVADKAPAILIGLHWLDVGGAESLGVDSIHWALEAGLRVIVITGQEGAERLLDKLPLEHPNFSLLRTGRYVPRREMSAFLGNLVAEENIIATHNHHCIPLYDALPTLKVRHPHVVHIDSTHIVEYLDGGYPRISGVWSNYIDYHHVISRELEAFYSREFRVHGRRLILGRLLDETERGKPLPPLRIKAGQKTCRVAFVGRMVHQKRPIVVVEIMRRLARWGRRNGVDFSFDMVGEGPYLAAVEHLLTRYRLGEQVRLHGAGSDVPAILKENDIMILPSSNEGLALVCYEAIGAGCVAISSDVGAQRELCPAELLVPWSPRGTVRKTVKKVQRLLLDPTFAPKVEAAQIDRLEALQAEPSAREVLMPIYAKALDDHKAEQLVG